MTEFSLCVNDPIYFINKYVLKLKPFQEDMLEQVHQHPNNLVNSARQMGVTTVLAAYTLWLTLFREDHTTVLLDVKLTNAIKTLELIKGMYAKLPGELKRGEVFNNKRDWELDNKSRVKTTSSVSDLCGLAVSFLIVDNAAFRNDLTEVTQQITSKVVVASTLYKAGWFTDRCIEAEKQKSDYNYIKLPYHLDTKKRRVDRMHAGREIGEAMAKIEWDCTHYLENNIAKALIDE